MDSSGGSFNTSSGTSGSVSGSSWSPEQLQRISALYPTLMSTYQSSLQQTPYADLLSTIGGPNQVFNPLTAFPDITQGPIWSPDQIQGRVNQARAQNDMGVAQQQRQLTQGAVGRGYGAGSPLLQELSANLYGQNLAANTGAENDLRWGAAQGNATHLLNTQQAGVGRATAMNQADLQRSQAMSEDDIRRRQLAVAGQGQELQYKAAQQNALLQAMGYYNQPLQSSHSSSQQQSASGGGQRSDGGSAWPTPSYTTQHYQGDSSGGGYNQFPMMAGGSYGGGGQSDPYANIDNNYQESWTQPYGGGGGGDWG